MLWRGASDTLFGGHVRPLKKWPGSKSRQHTTEVRMYTSQILTDFTHGFGTAGVSVEQYCGDAILPQPEQVHGNTVHVLGKPGLPKLTGDAFITSEPGVVCFVRTADCVPILIADPVQNAVGAIHAGWRGAEQDVVGATIRKMRDAFGSDPAHLCAAIGPSICGDCYDVDLRSIVHDQLTRAGVSKNNIDMLNLCTKCGGANLASYRRNKTAIRQVSFVKLFHPR